MNKTENDDLFEQWLKEHFPPKDMRNLVPGVRFERKRKGYELWWNPTGKRRRSNSIYFGFIGKRMLNKLVDQPDRNEQIRQIVQSMLTEKKVVATLFLGFRIFLRR